MQEESFTSLPQLGHRQALFFMRACRAANVPALMWGGPGIGKSSIVDFLRNDIETGEPVEFRRHEANLEPIETLIGSIADPTEIMGFPHIDQSSGVVKYVPREWVARIRDAGRGVLFLDELTTCPPSVQNALLKLVLDRTAGDYVLPADTMIIAAANPPSMMIDGGNELTPPMSNRFAHFVFSPMKGNAERINDINSTGMDTYLKGMIEGWESVYAGVPIPKARKEADIVNTQSALWSFLKFNPGLLVEEFEHASDARLAFATNRSWDAVSRLLRFVDPAQEDPFNRSMANHIISSLVGSDKAALFLNHLDGLTIPSPEDILESIMKTGTFQYDNWRNATHVWAMTNSVVQYYVMNPVRYFAPVKKFMNILVENMNTEVGMTFYKRVFDTDILMDLVNNHKVKRTELLGGVADVYGAEQRVLQKALDDAHKNFQSRKA